MDRRKNAAPTDFDFLNQLKSLSFLSPVARQDLASQLDFADFRRGAPIFHEKDLAAGVHILLRGVVKITCLNPTGRRVTIALVAPGPIPQFVSLPVDRWHFRCEAHSDCRVGSVNWDQFDLITRDVPRADLRKFHENNLTQWYRFFGGSLDLRERLLLTLLQLCSIFGVQESRGMLLRVLLTHKDLAGLVGASRPRVTEHMEKFEREHIIVRQGRQMIVCLDKLESSLGIPRRERNQSFSKGGAQSRLPYVDRLYGHSSLAAAAH
ncbi:Crp/Fnr family transcriptional regulator [Candidatus Binatus sp.]|uniref:Crp/Fnr family transcriptional regulator n=1 Tax=Candidatus Binatus sp. TaxID=2811406 RepID=UPI003C5010AB